MPRVHTLTARKDYPAEGITKGQTYFKWTTRVTIGKSYRGVVHRSAKRPSRAQLTSSDFLREVYGIEDGMCPECPDDLESTLADIDQLKSDQEEKLDNMPEGLKEGSVIQERIDALEDWHDRVEEAKNAWEAAAEDDRYGDPDNSEFADYADNTSYEGP